MAITVTKYLDWFSKSDDGDTVTYRVRMVVEEDGVLVSDSFLPDRYGSDAELSARALAAGRTAVWGEDDLCAEYGLTRAPGAVERQGERVAKAVARRAALRPPPPPAPPPALVSSPRTS